jgi:hypothetical protein
LIQESKARQEQYQLQYAQETQQEEENDEPTRDDEDEAYRTTAARSPRTGTITAYPGTLEHYIQTRQQFLTELRQLEPCTHTHTHALPLKYTLSHSFSLSLTFSLTKQTKHTLS